MSRSLFLARLRQGLKGLSPAEIDEIVTDYDAHFHDALAAGRSEADVSASLGDGLRLGNEHRAETKLRRWEERRSPRNFISAGLGLIGLQAFNILILLPVLAGLLFCAAIAVYVLYVVGSTGFHLLADLASGGGNWLVPGLVGVGLISGVIGMGGALALLLNAGLRLLGRYVRLNYRLFKPGDSDEE